MIRSKTNIKIIILIVVLLLFTLALISCQPGTQIKEAKTVEINSEEDFKALLANNIGEDYSLYTYEIKSDLDFTSEDWKPIAAGAGDFLMGTIDGKNHTIKYKIECEAQKTSEDLIDVENLDDNAYYSLIAKAKNLKIKNLKIEASISYETCANISYASSLIAHAVDSVVISNVSVEGNILNKIPDLAKHNYDIEEEPLEKLTDYEGHTTQYVGGVVGYGFDNISFNNVKSSINIDTQKSSNGFAKDMFTGGIVGYIRSTILTNGANKNTISNSEYSGDISATGMNVFLGGASGYSENLNVSQFSLKSSNLNVYFVKKLNLGGIVGQAIRSDISESIAMQEVILESNKITDSFNAIIDSSAIEAASIGGAVGYLEDNSGINDCSINLNIIVVEGKKYYIGGLVGELADSVIKDCVVKGNLMVSKNVNLKDYVFDFSGTNAEKSKGILNRVLNSSGIVGRVGYKASFNNIATQFVAFRNSCAEKHDDMKNFSVEEDVLVGDPNLENYLKGKGYFSYSDFIDKVLQQEQSESQKKDKIVSCSVFFKIVSEEVSYSLDSSVYEDLKDNPAVVEIIGSVNPLVFGNALSKIDADTKFVELKDTIESRIITE